MRKVGTWTAVAELPILLSIFSDTDVATVLRAERQLNLSGRVAPRDAWLRTADTPHLRRLLHLSPCLPRKGDHGRGSRLAPGGLLPREKTDRGPTFTVYRIQWSHAPIKWITCSAVNKSSHLDISVNKWEQRKTPRI